MSNEEEKESESGVEAEIREYAEMIVTLGEVTRRNLGIGVGSIEGGSHQTLSELLVCQVKHIPLAALLTPSCRV